jgi:hypothetical protein
MSTALVKGSIADIAERDNTSIAESFVGATCVVIIDTSGSMGEFDIYDESRYTRACKELERIQAAFPGKIAVVGFSDRVWFYPEGRPEFQHGNTDMAAALCFVHAADVPGMRFILISDGEPDSEAQTLREAAKFRNKIDTIFIGREGSPGADFLQGLARATGGITSTTEMIRKELGDNVIALLEATA